MNSKSKVNFPMFTNNDFLICLDIIYYIYRCATLLRFCRNPAIPAKSCKFLQFLQIPAKFPAKSCILRWLQDSIIYKYSFEFLSLYLFHEITLSKYIKPLCST